MTDEELDALVERLKQLEGRMSFQSQNMTCARTCHLSAAAITTLRTQLAEAQDRLTLEMDSLNAADRRAKCLVKLLKSANAHADRAEQLAATLEQRVATLEHEVRLREAALAAQIEADTWQPIETAPKDGTDFIAWWPFNYSGKVVPCHWVEGKGNRKGYFKYMSIKIEPTHWKSFPSNPDQPHDRTALDRMLAEHEVRLREARKKALREAAELCSSIRQRIANGTMPEGARFDYEQSILAMIEKDREN